MNLHNLRVLLTWSFLPLALLAPFSFFLNLQTSHILKTSGNTPAQELTMDRTLPSSKPKVDIPKKQIFLLKDKSCLSVRILESP